MNHSRYLCLIIAALFAAAASAQADTYPLDPVHSTGVFSIHHFNASFTWGLIGQPTGTIEYDAADPSKISFAVSVSLDHLDTMNKQRDNDLKGPDWFNAKQFPTIEFKSTAVKKTGETTYDVTGDFTLHGVTKSITVPMEMTGIGGMPNQARIGFQTLFTIHRSDYDMKTMPSAVGDDVKIIVSLEGVRK